MTNDEKVERYLRRIAPRSASNAEIARFTEVQPHQQVFQITKRLLQQGRIKGGRHGNEWRFWIEGDGAVGAGPSPTSSVLTPAPDESASVEQYRQFEVLACGVMSDHYGTALAPAKVPGVGKLFDYVSGDHTIVGDAKCFSLVQGTMLPPAKFSVIAEHVWLLEKTRAAHRFLVFGNDRRVPLRWLDKYGGLVDAVEFFFIDGDARLHKLH
jgi:hypothetical protein